MSRSVKIVGVGILVAAMLCITAFAFTRTSVLTGPTYTITARLDAEKPQWKYTAAQASVSLAPAGTEAGPEIISAWIYLFGFDEGQETLSYVADNEYDYGSTLSTPYLDLSDRMVTSLKSENRVMGAGGIIYHPDDIVVN